MKKKCCTKLKINSETGIVLIKSFNSTDQTQTIFRSVAIITAIGRGFSPSNAMDLLDDEKSLQIIELKNLTCRSRSKILRIKSRIIGENGKVRRNIERLSNTKISVYGKTVSIIGNHQNIKLVTDTIISLSKGSMHNTIYKKLEVAKKYEKLDKLKLWEEKHDL